MFILQTPTWTSRRPWTTKRSSVSYTETKHCTFLFPSLPPVGCLPYLLKANQQGQPRGVPSQARRRESPCCLRCQFAGRPWNLQFQKRPGLGTSVSLFSSPPHPRQEQALTSDAVAVADASAMVEAAVSDASAMAEVAAAVSLDASLADSGAGVAVGSAPLVAVAASVVFAATGVASTPQVFAALVTLSP